MGLAFAQDVEVSVEVGRIPAIIRVAVLNHGFLVVHVGVLVVVVFVVERAR